MEYVAAAYWGNRSEGVPDCSNRLARFGAMLGMQREDLRYWPDRSKKRKKNEQNPRLDLADKSMMERILREGITRTEIGDEEMLEGGSRIHLWNSGPLGRLSLRIRCGSYMQQFSNFVLLELHLNPAEASKLGFELVRAIAESWEPDWAGFIEERKMYSIVGFDSTYPYLDVALYVKEKKMLSRLKLDGRTVEPFDSGWLVR